MSLADCVEVDESDEVSPGQRDIPRWEKWLVGTLFAWFILRVLFLAISINPAIPPDEVTHVELSRIYSTVFLIPENGPTTMSSGLVNHIPGLYYWVMGRVINLNPFTGQELFVLRLANALMGLLTVLYGYRFMLRFSCVPIVRVLFVAVFSNTLMMTGLAASVNYDNLVNLLAAISIYRLFVFFDAPRSKNLILCLIPICAGTLTKTAFLPLAFLLVLAVLFYARQEWLKILKGLLASFRYPTLRVGSLYAVVLLGLVLNAGLYGGNLLTFGKLIPSADQVVSVEDALRNRIFARNYITREYRAGKLELSKAMQMTNQIQHPGDRADTRHWLRMARNPNPYIMGPLAYSSTWSLWMSRIVVSYLGHRFVIKTNFEWLPYLAIFIVSILIMLWKWPGLKKDGVGYAVFIVAGYLLVLMWLVNYQTYQETHVFGQGLQGRYLYPVWVPFCGLLAHYCLCPAAKMPHVRIGIAILVASVFIYGDVPSFLLAIDSAWFSPRQGLPPIGWGG